MKDYTNFDGRIYFEKDTFFERKENKKNLRNFVSKPRLSSVCDYTPSAAEKMLEKQYEQKLELLPRFDRLDREQHLTEFMFDDSIKSAKKFLKTNKADIDYSINYLQPFMQKDLALVDTYLGFKNLLEHNDYKFKDSVIKFIEKNKKDRYKVFDLQTITYFVLNRYKTVMFDREPNFFNKNVLKYMFYSDKMPDLEKQFTKLFCQLPSKAELGGKNQEGYAAEICSIINDNISYYAVEDFEQNKN